MGRKPFLDIPKTRWMRSLSIVSGRKTPGNRQPRASPHIRSVTVDSLVAQPPIARVLLLSRVAGPTRLSSLSCGGGCGPRSTISLGPSSWMQNQSPNTSKRLGSTRNAWQFSLLSTSSATGSPPVCLFQCLLYMPMSFSTMSYVREPLIYIIASLSRDFWQIGPLLCLPLFFLVVYDFPRDRPWLYQTYLGLSVWSWPLYTVVFM